MRRSPPLLIQARVQPRLQALIAGFAALVVVGQAAWLGDHEPRAWALLALAPLAGWWAWRLAAVLERRLRWDGEAWWLSEPSQSHEAAVKLRVLIDLDRWLLLRAAPAESAYWDWRGRRYLALDRAGLSPVWGQLRATLYAARQT